MSDPAIRLARILRRLAKVADRLSMDAPIELDCDQAYEWGCAVALAAAANALMVGGASFWRMVDVVASASRRLQGGKRWPDDFPPGGCYLVAFDG